MVTEEQLNLKNIKKSAWLTFTEFLHEVNHTLMNDFAVSYTHLGIALILIGFFKDKFKQENSDL